MSFDWLSTEIDRLRTEGLLRTARWVVPREPGWCEVEGRRLLNFAGNDYLGLAGDPRLQAAAARAAADAGTGARASPLVCGRTEWHERLELRLAEFEQTEAALLFPSGFAANVGTITALVGRGDAVYCDRLNHASLIDGCKLSSAALKVYPHCDVAALDQTLAKGIDYRRRLIVTDSVFSMDGDEAPLRELCELAARHDAMLLIDEAHATGVYGRSGRGLTEAQDVDSPRIVKVGTLSKALGSIGGFVVGSRQLIDWLFNAARTQMFSTGLPPAACAAASAAVEIVQREPEQRARLLRESHRLREGLPQTHAEFCSGGNGPIIPVVLGDPDQAVAIAQALEHRGFLVACVRPPTVPRGTARLRISLSAAHAADDVTALAEAIRDVLSV